MAPLHFYIHILCIFSLSVSICLQVFWVAPMLAGVAAALLYDFLLCPHSVPYTKRLKAIRGEPTSETARLPEPSGSEGPQWPTR